MALKKDTKKDFINNKAMFAYGVIKIDRSRFIINS